METSRQGWALGGYLSGRLNVAQPVSLEAGVRWDARTYSDQEAISPRLAVELRPGDATTLRAGWGVYWRPRRIHELDVAYGRTTYDAAQTARQFSASLEQVAGDAVRLGLEAYRRKIENPLPYHLNLDGELPLLPEISLDRAWVAPERGEARGVEASLSSARGGEVGWGLSYAWSRAEDRWRGRTLPRPWDQAHALKAHLAWRPTDQWTLSFTNTYHTGWPSTDPEVVQRILDRKISAQEALARAQDERLEPYHRGDLRLERAFGVGGGSLRLHLDVVNVYDHHNVRAVRVVAAPASEGGGWRTIESSYFPRLVLGGIRYAW